MSSALVEDLRQALRLLRRSPGLSLFHIGLLASVVAVVSLAFNVYDVFFLRAAAVRSPERLFRLSYDVPNMGNRSLLSALALRTMAENASVESVTGYTGFPDVAIADDLGAIEVRSEAVMPNYFPVLGVGISAGRALGEEDREPGAEVPVVISDRFWRQRYGGDRAAIGKRVSLNDLPARIVGVTEQTFNGFSLDSAAEVRFPYWVAARLYPTVKEVFGPDTMSFNNLVLLRPGIEAPSVLAALKAAAIAGEEASLPLQSGYYTDYMESLRQARFELEPGARSVSLFRERHLRALEAFLAAATLLFLLVAANLGGLWLARAIRREAEMAVRLAIGAGRGRLTRQFFFEAMLLGSAAAAIAVVLTSRLAPLLPLILPPTRDYGSSAARPISADFSASPEVLLVGVAATFFATFLLAFAPAVAVFRLRPIDALKRLRVARGWAGQRVFLVAQIALSSALVVAALLATNTLRNLMNMDLGFDVDRVAVFDVKPRAAGYSGTQCYRLQGELVRRIGSLPSVEGVAFGGGLIEGIGMSTTFYPTGTEITRQEQMNTSVLAVSPGFFSVVGQPLRRGREFSESDSNRQRPRPMLVNESYAHAYFPNVDPVGRTIGNADPGKPADAEGIIVGVVADAQFRSLRDQKPRMIYNLWRYLPPKDGGTDPGYAMKMYVRSSAAPESIFEPVRRTIRDLDSSVPVTNLSTLREQRDLSLRSDTLAVGLATVFTGFAFVVAGLGIFSLLSRMVAARTKEMGVRMALGAGAGDVFRLVLGQALAIAAGGLAVGLTLCFLWYPAADDLFRGVTGRDPLILAAGALLVFGMAAIAAILPAQRAARVHPVKALREE